MGQDLIYKEESYKIIGACFNVYKTMGCGFLVPVYQECLEMEFEECCIPFSSQKEIKLQYCGKTLKNVYKPNFICYEKIIVEIKAVSNLTKEYEAQTLNYLNATGFKFGLLVNFGHYPQLEYKKMVL